MTVVKIETIKELRLNIDQPIIQVKTMIELYPINESWIGSAFLN